ncbi:TauD/TfdA family dioxygenase [Pararoseomonas sp. SCSIO 73927]|uniref:TauD/TfdA family dioxygenase n=1 Tax=Pararoseomonas sp. SCSIO 73927 TaxID=3114537 RepID=UPI0030D0C9D4
MPAVETPQGIVLEPGRLAAALATAPDEDPCIRPIELRDRARAMAGTALASEDMTSVRHFAHGLEPWLVVRAGMDLSRLPPTPLDFPPVQNDAWWPLGWLTVGLMALAGARLVSYACENGGDAFVNLVARPEEDVGAGPAERSRKAMRGHTDGASFPFPSEFAAGDEVHSPAPDLLVLVGLRNPEGTPTRLAPVSLALKNLTDEELWAMEGPWFDIAPQATFDTDRVRVGAPILSRREPRHGLSMRFSHGRVAPSHGAPAAAGIALRRFKEALADLYVEVPIGPGDVCLIHNRQVIHGRAATGPGVGGTTRWLLRTYGWMDGTLGHRQPGGPPHCHR